MNKGCFLEENSEQHPFSVLDSYLVAACLKADKNSHTIGSKKRVYNIFCVEIFYLVIYSCVYYCRRNLDRKKAGTFVYREKLVIHPICHVVCRKNNIFYKK